ncbi:MAG: hypothetical protein JNL08_15795 [Planctomycetes bacterium]|nr:hypothetical protein [Planctomycetota bacterium]
MPFVPLHPWPQLPAPEAAPSFWQRLLALGSEPGVVEVLLAATILAVVVVAWWRLARLVSGARSRRALADYLLGVEQALHGDLRGAKKRLAAVVATDPENHYARLLLGKVLADLGEPEQAHTQHLYLQRAFAIDSPENDLMLAQSLLAAGLPTEAAEAAERALQRAPERADGWEFVYRARLQCGDFDAAAAAGRRLLDLVRDGGRRGDFARDLARTLAQAGALRLDRGDTSAADAALQQARRLHDGCDALPLLAARLAARRDGVEPTARAWLGDTASPAALVPVAGAVAAPSRGLPMATLAGLAVPSRWACSGCGQPLAAALAECPRCAKRSPATLQEPGLVADLASASHAMDAIEQNEAHVLRLVRALLDGEGRERQTARAELLELREVAVEELLRQAWHRQGTPQEAAIEVLRTMGPTIAPALFAASDVLEQQRLLPVGSRSPAALVGRIVQGFDRTALPHVGALFSSARPEHRKILIDFFLGLADLQEFQLVLERFPPLEILHRFNKSDSAVLRRFLQAVPAGHFVAETLLLEPAFYREDEVLAAIPGAAHPEVLERALLRRGPTRTLTKALIAAVDCGDALAEVAGRLLAQLGAPVVDHVLAACTDVERSPEARRRLGDVLARIGAPAVEDLCASFGPEPTPLDADLTAILVAIGDAAVPALREAYDRSGWLEKVSIGLIARHTNRRAQIVLALARLGTPLAAAALRALRTEERDTNLRLRLDRALHDLGDAAEGGGDGPR